MPRNSDLPWTTLWDRPNRRVLLLAGAGAVDHHCSSVKHDQTASIPGVYDIWRVYNACEECSEDIVFVEIHLDDKDTPLGFPRDLLDEDLLGSMTLWPAPDLESFIWWH
jgi:hypothetical protein